MYGSAAPHRLPHGIFRRLIAGVGVDVEGHARVGVPHEVLQALEVDPAVGHLGTEGVAQDVGRDGGQLVLVGVVVSVYDPLHHMLQHGHLGLFAALDGVLKGPIYLVRHGDVPLSAGRLGLFHIVLAVPGPGQLPLHLDPPGLKVQVRPGQSVEFTDPHSRPQQNDDLVVVLGIMPALPDKDQEPLFDLPGDRLAGLGIVGHHIGDLEGKRIAPDDVILHRHLKGRTQNAPDAGDGAVSPAILIQFDEPLFGV